LPSPVCGAACGGRSLSRSSRACSASSTARPWGRRRSSAATRSDPLAYASCLFLSAACYVEAALAESDWGIRNRGWGSGISIRRRVIGAIDRVRAHSGRIVIQ
jgi:hypothetical protein